MDLHPLGVLAVDATRHHATSALPDAPVVPPRQPRRPGKVRRGAAGTLRRIADRLDTRRPAR